jgi:hopene-associated glycosyltransferase HpnB
VLTIGIASVAVWIYLLLARGGFWRIPRPSRDRQGAVPAHANVAIVIPARDEASGIGQAVDSLVDQASIIVVDDHSSDATADIARRHGATVIGGQPLPLGWTGKMWAVAQGVDAALAARPDYVLLTDADIVHAPGNVASLVARAEAHGFDLVSLMVRLRTESFAERALIPAFVFFFLKLYPPAWISSPRHRTAGAAGGCILIRRDMIDRIGGIETIRGEMIDDCALARAVKRTGGKVWLGLTRETRSIRAYGGFAEIWRMISRTAFTQLNYSPLLLCGTLAGLALTYLAPPALALTFSPIAAPQGTAAWLMMSISYAPMLRFYGRSILWAPALPLVALFYAGATIDSAVRYWTGRGGAWKGRTQALNTTPQ